jgi:hypothetical protein
MLTREENETLVRTGPDTPMGRMIRRFWLPVCSAHQVAEPDGAPLRTQLLGEHLVVFRDTDGEVGVHSEFCVHRRASLALGRNEEGEDPLGLQVEDFIRTWSPYPIRSLRNRRAGRTWHPATPGPVPTPGAKPRSRTVDRGYAIPPPEFLMGPALRLLPRQSCFRSRGGRGSGRRRYRD